MTKALQIYGRMNRTQSILLTVVIAVFCVFSFRGCGNDDPDVKISGNKNPPKAVVENNFHDFGITPVGVEKFHEFTVKNEGKGPLFLQSTTPPCTCFTIHLLNKVIEPGESGKIRIQLLMKKTRQVFNKSILIATNDPDNDQLQLKLRGSGVTSYMTMPNGRWDFGAIAYAENEKAKEVKGYIFSKQHEHLELKYLSLSNDRFSFSVEPIDEENKKKFQAKSGYAITVKTDERIPVGAIFDRLKFTVVGKHFQKDGSVRIRARRIGPFIFQPFKDVFWIPKDNALDLGTISAKKGISKKVTMLVTGMGKQDLKILNYVKKTPKFLNLKMIKDPTFESETQQRYELVFEIPPNQPPSTYLRRNPGVIELETNHPTAKLMRFYIEFISN